MNLPASGRIAPVESVTAEFDRVLLAITSGTNRFQDLTAEETAALVAVLEDKRAEDAARRAAMPNYPSRVAGRVLTVVTSDPRSRAIFEMRLQRRRIAPEGPVRYLGFSTTAACRVFSFGRLPPRDETDLFEIRIPHTFFGPRQISMQEGPGFCAVILVEKAHPSSYDVTAQDVQEYVAKKPGKGSKR